MFITVVLWGLIVLRYSLHSVLNGRIKTQRIYVMVKLATVFEELNISALFDIWAIQILVSRTF